jgi:hypothetical protein
MVLLTRVKMPSAEPGQAEFYLSEITPLGNEEKKWGFSLHGKDAIFIAQFVYCDEGHAQLGAAGIVSGLNGIVLVVNKKESQQKAARKR